MDLGYNKEIKLSEITFPEGFIFEKTGKRLYIEARYGIKVIVSSSGIEIISDVTSFLGRTIGTKSLLIEKDNISDFSIEMHFFISRNSPDSGKPLYKIVIHLKEEVEIQQSSKYTQTIELFANDHFNSKLTAYFIIQEFCKILKFPLRNSSQNKDSLDAPNFCHFDVVENDNQNLIIKRKPTQHQGEVMSNISFGLFCFVGFIIIMWIVFSGIQLKLANGYNMDMYMLMIMNAFSCFLLFVSFIMIYHNKFNQGFYVSIDSDQISISKLKFFDSIPSNHPKNIVIAQNISIEINKVEPLLKRNKKEKNNFEVVVYENNEDNSKKTVLINKITQQEAEYLVKKIRYLANKGSEKKLNFSDKIEIIENSNAYKPILVALFAIFFIFGVPYIMVELAQKSLYRVNAPETLDSYVLKNLGYSSIKGYSSIYWNMNNKDVTTIHIPNSYEYKGKEYYITKIGARCFQHSRTLEKIFIPRGVTTIEEEAFDDCVCLELEIPNSVTKIGRNAFRGVQHIKYHGNATGAPWGAMSMN